MINTGLDKCGVYTNISTTIGHKGECGLQKSSNEKFSITCECVIFSQHKGIAEEKNVRFESITSSKHNVRNCK